MPRLKRKFSPEYREEAVKLVIETSRPVAQVAKEIGVHEGTLRNWVNAYQGDHVGEDQIGNALSCRDPRGCAS